MEKYAVIMAGGTGTRLWPLSKENKPKQFINVDGTEPLLVQTVERICTLIPSKNCFVITNERYVQLTRETLKNHIPEENIIYEPLKKNTAACISYATLYLEKLLGNGIVCFIPADSYVKDKDEYLQSIKNAYDAAENNHQIVIIGVTPSYPATGFGYIQVNPEEYKNEKGVSQVVQFKEKPNVETAQEYVQSGSYLWNSGMVVGELNALRKGIEKFLPTHFQSLAAAVAHREKDDFQFLLAKAFTQLEDISFDYGVLEKTKDLLAVKGSFGWYDIGSLDSISIAIEGDENNNAVYGKHVGIDTTNSIIYSLDNLITTIGLKDIIVVDVGDSIIVCPKDRAQDVKKLVDLLKTNGFESNI
ncbi:mannose-1-phosphate guanylyltransferase [Niallia sp. 01092]|uniref:mannose-1-phosphate guanylyltransferase n=1 Tax=unclassified Niallia TaxID=2837522 RepID=UPI003FD2AEC3